MKKVRLGELEVSAIGLGCMGMSQAYGEADPAESERTLHRALDIGVTFLDTANAYGLGHNETLIGKVLKDRRDEMVLATKFGIFIDEDGNRGINGKPDQVAARCDESLERLQTDVIDLYYLHRLDPDVPIEDTVGAMAELVRAGKVRYLGLSEVSAATLRRAHAVHPIAAVQSEYSLWTRDPEPHVLPACRELGVGFVPFSPLGRAILTGAIGSADDLSGKRDMRGSMPRFQGENLERNLATVAAFEELATARSCTRGQLALAWLLAQGSDIAPIPGTKRVSYLEENAAAADIELSSADIQAIDTLFAPDNIAGDRYAPAGMRSLDRD
jgi:aryl-alcohol dehydrogenase-like predicted oxidoreductase